MILGYVISFKVTIYKAAAYFFSFFFNFFLLDIEVFDGFI